MIAASGTRPIKRRSRSEIGAIKQVIREVLADSHPATVRQTYYQLVARGAIAKTEIEYKSTVVRLLTAMRRSGEIPFGWIADNTRWMRKPRSYSSLTDMLTHSQRFYRRALWDDQDVYVEIWLEKDALSGVLYNVTAEFDVPLMVTRGYPSISYLYEAGETIAETQKPAYLYYFGDYDPSGCDITRAVESGIREFAPEAEIHFERLAVTREQVAAWSLPSRPTKQSDSRSEGFDGDSVEVDSIPPAKLRELVRAAITRHIDPHQMAASRAIEEQERETLRRIIGNLGRAA
jgi:hypothetical protein